MIKIVFIIGVNCGFGCQIVLDIVCQGGDVIVIYCGSFEQVEVVVVDICVLGCKVIVLLLDMV